MSAQGNSSALPTQEVLATYDLRFRPWVPFRRRSGVVEWLAPYAITSGVSDDPIVALACPRPDFNAALTEFLIGLYSVALAPTDEDGWAQWCRTPPPPEALRAFLAKLPNAFSLDGDGPRILQDQDPLQELDPIPIQRLLIDAPGDQAQRLNTDLFVKRDRVADLGRPASAMALLTMQNFAPAGGQGNRTSMRGGGPLMTVVDPRSSIREEPLWQMLWANAETVEQLDERDGDRSRAWSDADVYPWLAATRVSGPAGTGLPTRPIDAAPMQTYFGMPRRIRLDFESTSGVCELSGEPDTVMVRAFRAKNYGVQYLGWRHPLTPYYTSGDGERLPLHAQPGGVGWRDWQGLLFERAGPDGSSPAQVVAQFRSRRANGPFRLLAAGYDMDKMKARGWVQSELPAYPDEVLDRVREFTDQATAAAKLVAQAVTFAVKEALLQRPKDAPGDYRHLRDALWSTTQSSFFDLVAQLATRADAAAEDTRRSFRVHLRQAALDIFDQACPIEAGLHPARLRRPIAARHRLVMTLEGYGKSGKTLFGALNLGAPGGQVRQRGPSE